MFSTRPLFTSTDICNLPFSPIAHTLTHINYPSYYLLTPTNAPVTDDNPEEWHLSSDPKRPWNQCACALSNEEIERRMRVAVSEEEVAALEAKEAAVAKLRANEAREGSSG
jgi:hypothetical protein